MQKQVRALAVKNARDRATAYAKQLGQTVGKAYVIREEEADTPGYTTSSFSGNGNGTGKVATVSIYANQPPSPARSPSPSARSPSKRRSM